jgi:hypothetical protein
MKRPNNSLERAPFQREIMKEVELLRRSARNRYISPTSGAISRIVKCLLIRKRISEPQS